MITIIIIIQINIINNISFYCIFMLKVSTKYRLQSIYLPVVYSI